MATTSLLRHQNIQTKPEPFWSSFGVESLGPNREKSTKNQITPLRIIGPMKIDHQGGAPVTTGAVVIKLEFCTPLTFELFWPIPLSLRAGATSPLLLSSFCKVVKLAIAGKIGVRVMRMLLEEEGGNLKDAEGEGEEDAGASANSCCKVRRRIAGVVNSSPVSHAIGKSTPITTVRRINVCMLTALSSSGCW